MKPIVLDGRTGEGGGQLVRIACGLAALTSQAVTIEHVRGNREGGRGGGLKAQHVTSLSWLAAVTGAETSGLAVGSETLTFCPRRPPTDLAQRRFRIEAASDAASALLVLQAIFPYVLFAANDAREPVVLDLWGGTNVRWSLSYEYFDQVLAPTLEERFGIRMERELKARGWSLGPPSRGHMTLTVHPVARGQTLRFVPREGGGDAPPASPRVARVVANMVVPGASRQRVQEELVAALGGLYADAELEFDVVEDSGSDARWSILLVAHSAAGVRWARDSLFSMPGKPSKTPRQRVIRRACRRLCRQLYDETSRGGTVDEFLQDQLLSLQALAEGDSSFLRGAEDPAAASAMSGPVRERGELAAESTGMRRDETHEPFGHGSTHTTTARWVISQLLPRAEFYNSGDVVRGVGFSL